MAEPRIARAALERSRTGESATPEAKEPFGIYVHWPFCLAKCPYCDFNSHVSATIDAEEWRRAYLVELDFFSREAPSRPVTSLFFGGGTPSLMEPATVGAVIDAIAARHGFSDDAEITLEANPGAVDAARFKGFRQAGVNRLSMGFQALDDESLKALGRIHGVAESMEALDLAQREFSRISFDLIYARSGQTLSQWEAELLRALDLAGEHLSLYQLTIEEGTPFAAYHKRGTLTVPDEDTATEMFELTQSVCAAADLPAYEVSNHARPGAECRHNLLYWRVGDWLGIGPGAHGRFQDAAGQAWALRQKRTPRDWLRAVATTGHGTEERVALAPNEMAEEMLMMGLRLSEGLSITRFHDRTGLVLNDWLDPAGLSRMQAGDFVEWTADALRATESGRRVLNGVIGALVRE